jgi:cytochrome oxidase Cu insertion factor (SCO1/SenC/PrrC family)
MPDGARFWRPPRYALPAVAAALGVLIGLTAALVRGGHAPAAEQPGPLRAQVTWAAGANRAPAFTLVDQDGRHISLRSLHGRPVLVTFLDSKCKRECPVEGRVLGNVLHELTGTQAAVLVVSVDPWADSRRSARAFAAKARWQGDWHWLLGDRAALAPVWRDFNIAVKRVPGDILHSAALYLIDGQGYMRAAYLFPFSANVVASDTRRLSN